MPQELFFIRDLIIALLLGSLIGIERERSREAAGKGRHEFGGVRTMSLIAMFGYLVHELFSDQLIVFTTFVLGFWSLIVASYVVSSIQNKNSGATTEIAGIFVFLIGILTAMDQHLFASAIALLVAILLFFKGQLHNFAKKLEKEELFSTFKFIAVAFVILPLLPDRTIDPMMVINPNSIWFFMVLVSGISFLSYIAVKILGAKRGLGLGGFFGGLVSSTALSVTFSNLSKKNRKIINPFVFGILIACSAMFFRVLIEVLILNRDLIPALLLPMVLMGVTGIVLSMLFWYVDQNSKYEMAENDLSLKSPLQLLTAIKFAFLLMILLVISKYATVHFGSNGLYLTALFSGMVDVDAISISMANLSAIGDVQPLVAATTITIAVITNTLVKAGIVFAFASRQVGKRVLGSIVLIVAVGIVTLLINNSELVYGLNGI